MKKLLFIILLFLFSFSYSQEKRMVGNASHQNEQQVTLTSVSAYPNPFTVKTRINFKSTKFQLVEFSVKNLLGKTVYIEKINCKEGYNSIPFNRDDLPQGMYIYSIQTETELVSKRMIIK